MINRVKSEMIGPVTIPHVAFPLQWSSNFRWFNSNAVIHDKQ
jgi:hypothetical protein